MNLIIDVGNTRVKIALFERFILEYQSIVTNENLFKEIKNLSKKNKINYAIISSVGSISKKVIKQLEKLFPLIELNHKTKVPFKNLYKTPKTLGVDRIALVSAGVSFCNTGILVIDAGTCITYDYVKANDEYIGGAISPGLAMRYKSLNNFTAGLPLLKTSYPENLIGTSTENSIHSGVVNGIISEIDGIISQYKAIDKNLTVVLTGGDTYFLAKRLKNSIFANPNFLLEGLNTILNYNIKND